MKQTFALGSAALALALLTGCATTQAPVSSAGQAPGYGPGYQQRAEYGRVQSIDLVRAENQTSGGGALLGGLVGAVVGRQIGSGSGRTAGTLVGAFGGAVIGNQIEKNQRGAQDFYRVVIRTEQGQARSFDYQQLADLHVGDRVRIEGNQVYRY
ncbi:MAG: glycine zipper 2TM domain-containing protein [Piscinibacter sp.]|nr:glycine zipper 2TM domain-containing protein [Piscinibacter sp.]